MKGRSPMENVAKPWPTGAVSRPMPLDKPAQWLGEQIQKALALSGNDIEFDRHRITLDPLGWLRGKIG